jgi:hypothetical protein
MKMLDDVDALEEATLARLGRMLVSLARQFSSFSLVPMTTRFFCYLSHAVFFTLFTRVVDPD